MRRQVAFILGFAAACAVAGCPTVPPKVPAALRRPPTTLTPETPKETPPVTEGTR